MLACPLTEARANLRAAWRKALFPVALRAIERGDFDRCSTRKDANKHTAGIIANYATTDMLLEGRTILLPMDEVRAVDPRLIHAPRTDCDQGFEDRREVVA